MLKDFLSQNVLDLCFQEQVTKGFFESQTCPTLKGIKVKQARFVLPGHGGKEGAAGEKDPGALP